MEELQQIIEIMQSMIELEVLLPMELHLLYIN